MPSKTRPDPVIPDHEVLRKIGGGAYGEVWLGRGVTGALRAIKVVWREDFEDARGFEREFEGILKFEPMSRDHPGLVHILHVGRSPDGVSFYYYVMELGDDVRTGQNINAIEYEPRTLRADTKLSLHPQLDTATCIDVGLRLAEALHHLHERGLAHRDVKPSNVIFLNGKAKLADIGLVAARDQRTFVGTEGFVPPEGPGSAPADVYSLGKVLYEIATGKDRLDFPELPDNLPSGSDRKRWLELNKIICDICEPRLSKRLITSASDLAEALRRLQKGKRTRRRKSSSLPWVLAFLLLGFCGWAAFEMTKRGDLQQLLGNTVAPPKPVIEKYGQVKVISYPTGARVYDSETGLFIDYTPTKEIRGKVGQTMKFRIELERYQQKDVVKTIGGEGVELINEKLTPDQPPEPGLMWMDHLRNRYQPFEGPKMHKSDLYVSERDWLRFNIETARKTEDFLPFSQNGTDGKIALADDEAAKAFCSWLEGSARRNGLLTYDFEMVPERNLSFNDPKMTDAQRKSDLRPFWVIVKKIDFGMVRLTTDPPGAEVFIDGVKRGYADGSVIERVKPGDHVKFLLLKEGFKQIDFEEKVIPSDTLAITKKMDVNEVGVVFGRNWKNSLGMEFVPLGENLMVSKWETRKMDYSAYVSEYNLEMDKKQAAGGGGDSTGDSMPLSMPLTPEFKEGDDSPIVYVSRDDADNFCRWLTQKERDKQLIGDAHEYRIPTDLEWSRMAGIEDDPSKPPIDREREAPKVFPWGTAWPPPQGAGNFADSSAALFPGRSANDTIPGYTDTYAYTSAVGSFAPNSLGLFDLSGNAQEWVSTGYQNENDQIGVLRGGGWATSRQAELYLGFRNPVYPTLSESSTGFRVVISRKVVKTQENPLDTTPAPPQPEIPEN